MDKEEIFHHYSNLLDLIIDSSDFYKVYFQSCYSLKEDEEINKNLILCSGLARACLIDKNYDYIIKIPILEGDCEREIFVYNQAIENGVEKFFARPEFIGIYSKVIHFYDVKEIENYFSWDTQDDFINKFEDLRPFLEKKRIIIDFPLYAYPRAESYNFNHYSKRSEKLAKKISSPLKNFNLAIAASFINDYGEELYKKLSTFLYDLDIGDLHLGNVGEVNNHICIIDYAG